MGAFQRDSVVCQTDAAISETVIHFAIQENIKQKLLEYKTASTMENEEECIKKCQILWE